MTTMCDRARRSVSGWWIGVWAIGFILATGRVGAQTDFQLWGDLTLQRLASDRVTYKWSIQPKVRMAPPEGQSWSELGGTSSAEFVAKSWMDLTGELYTGYTKQTEQLTSAEVSPRAGMRVHVWARDLPTLFRERPPKRRLVIRDYTRVEWRNLFYTGNTPTSSTWRFRNRLESLLPLNNHLITHDNTRYLLADWEWLIPVSDSTEKYASRQRIRAGLGYRRDVHWRVEALYVWDKSRNTAQGGFTRSESAIDLRLTRVFE